MPGAFTSPVISDIHHQASITFPFIPDICNRESILAFFRWIPAKHLRGRQKRRAHVRHPSSGLHLPSDLPPTVIRRQRRRICAQVDPAGPRKMSPVCSHYIMSLRSTHMRTRAFFEDHDFTLDAMSFSQSPVLGCTLCSAFWSDAREDGGFCDGTLGKFTKNVVPRPLTLCTSIFP